MRAIVTFCFFCFTTLFLLSGCTKKSGSYTYTFVNQTDQTISINIYRTLSDYTDNSITVVRGSVKPHDNFAIPSSALTDSKDYYVDWYSEDFAYSNWGDTTTTIKFTPSTENNTFIISNAQKNNYRRLCRSGLLKQTWWKAIDAYSDTNSSVSVWHTLSDWQQYHWVMYQHTFQSYLEYIPKVNDSVIDGYPYSLEQAGDTTYIHFKNLGTMYMCSWSRPGANPASIDTAWLYYNHLHFLMVKDSNGH